MKHEEFNPCKECCSPMGCRDSNYCANVAVQINNYSGLTSPSATPVFRSAPTGMKLAIPERCQGGHAYYRESGTESGCPYCLHAQVVNLRTRIRRGVATIAEIVGSLRHGLD